MQNPHDNTPLRALGPARAVRPAAVAPPGTRPRLVAGNELRHGCHELAERRLGRALVHESPQPIDGARIPRLADLFDLVQRSGNTTVGFDCETKVSPIEPDATLPPEEFARKAIAEIRSAGMERRTMVQSFDWRTLQVIQKEAPEIRTMYLSTPRTLAPAGRGRPSPWLAGFAPELQLGSSVPRAVHAAGGKIWAPNHQFLTPAMLAEARALGIAVIPWTVNDPPTIVKLLDMGVDGIISDRPDLVQIELRKRR